MNFKSKMMFGVGVTMLTLAANGTAQAQSAASSSAIGEVVVTATKAGVTNLQKTPLAVSVVGGDDLHDDRSRRQHNRVVPRTLFPHAGGSRDRGAGG